MLHNILLHICCAPCTTWVIKSLQSEGYNPLGYFYNPNIHPKEEYERRLKEIKQFASKIDFPLIIGSYEIKNWFKLTKGLEIEPEGGMRCKICYKMRLDRTARVAQNKGMDVFTTTLTISPHKSTNIINKIGQEVGERYGIKLLERDFKKKDGFKKSIILSEKHKLYRQSYCGCVFSL